PVAELTPSAETNQAVAGQQGGTGDQDSDLDRIVVGHGAHAAQGCVEPGEHDNEHGANPEAVDGRAADVQTQLGKESGEDHAAGRAGTRKADDMFRSDIGSENGSADDPPAEIAPGKEIVGGGVLSLAHDPPGHTEQDGEVERDHQPVNSSDVRLADRGEQQGG